MFGDPDPKLPHPWVAHSRTCYVVSPLSSPACTCQHPCPTLKRCEFSNAAATRSLSFNCLLTAFSLWCVLVEHECRLLKRSGSARRRRTRSERPIRVAILQCGMVGVNSRRTCWSLLVEGSRRDGDMVGVDYSELFESQRMFGVGDGSDQS